MAGVSTPPGKGRFGWSKTRVIASHAVEQPTDHTWLGEWVGKNEKEKPRNVKKGNWRGEEGLIKGNRS